MVLIEVNLLVLLYQSLLQRIDDLLMRKRCLSEVPILGGSHCLGEGVPHV